MTDLLDCEIVYQVRDKKSCQTNYPDISEVGQLSRGWAAG